MPQMNPSFHHNVNQFMEIKQECPDTYTARPAPTFFPASYAPPPFAPPSYVPPTRKYTPRTPRAPRAPRAPRGSRGRNVRNFGGPSYPRGNMRNEQNRMPMREPTCRELLTSIKYGHDFSQMDLSSNPHIAEFMLREVKQEYSDHYARPPAPMFSPQTYSQPHTFPSPAEKFAQRAQRGGPRARNTRSFRGSTYARASMRHDITGLQTREPTTQEMLGMMNFGRDQHRMDLLSLPSYSAQFNADIVKKEEEPYPEPYEPVPPAPKFVPTTHAPFASPAEKFARRVQRGQRARAARNCRGPRFPRANARREATRVPTEGPTCRDLLEMMQHEQERQQLLQRNLLSQANFVEGKAIKQEDPDPYTYGLPAPLPDPPKSDPPVNPFAHLKPRVKKVHKFQGPTFGRSYIKEIEERKTKKEEVEEPIDPTVRIVNGFRISIRKPGRGKFPEWEAEKNIYSTKLYNFIKDVERCSDEEEIFYIQSCYKTRGHRARYRDTTDQILEAYDHCSPGDMIIEMKGFFSLKSDCRRGPVHPIEGHFVYGGLRHIKGLEHDLLWIDASGKDNDAQFARRSETPNAKIKPIFRKSEPLTLAIIATEHIDYGEEITLPLNTLWEAWEKVEDYLFQF